MIAMGENNKYSHADRVSSRKRDKQRTKITLRLVSVMLRGPSIHKCGTAIQMQLNIRHTFKNNRERSGSVVECMTRGRGAAGSSLTGVTALCP